MAYSSLPNGWWQATKWPGAISFHSGTACLQISVQCAQRVWNLHPCGGLTGLGLGNSVQKNLYLPEAQNDFILAIIGEELGFIGILALVFVYVLLVWRGCHTAMNARDYTGMMLASGITMMVGLQVVINIAVVTSSMPPTGIILPFISYGGNALLIFMGAMGILLNISKSAEL